MTYGFFRVGGVTLAMFAVAGTTFTTPLGCGGDGASSPGAKSADGSHSRVIEHEPCDDSGSNVVALDANNDGKPDIKKVSKDGREVCRVTDLNHDGKPDMFEYFDSNGQVRRRESGYDDTAVIHSIEYFENGKLARRELDTTNQGRIDTWDVFDLATGARTKRERDATGDGKIDQWWTYEGQNVTIMMDRDGDGRPDPDATLVLGPNGQAIASDGGVSAASDAGVASPPVQVPIAPPTTPTAAPVLPTTAPAPGGGTVGTPQRGGAKR